MSLPCFIMPSCHEFLCSTLKPCLRTCALTCCLFYILTYHYFYISHPYRHIKYPCHIICYTPMLAFLLFFFNLFLHFPVFFIMYSLYVSLMFLLIWLYYLFWSMHQMQSSLQNSNTPTMDWRSREGRVKDLRLAFSFRVVK